MVCMRTGGLCRIQSRPGIMISDTDRCVWLHVWAINDVLTVVFMCLLLLNSITMVKRVCVRVRVCTLSCAARAQDAPHGFHM